jgi:hypothetical protein
MAESLEIRLETASNFLERIYERIYQIGKPEAVTPQTRIPGVALVEQK